MTLLIYYIAISAILDVGAVITPWASMPIFLTLYFLILWVAWIISVKITEPKVLPAARTPSDQRA